jgi:hypothetical protein
MIAIAASGSSLPATDAACAACIDELRSRLPTAPNHVICLSGSRHDQRMLQSGLRLAFPGVQLHGSTSCVGPTVPDGLLAGGVAVMGIADADGSFGSACRHYGGDPRGAATAATIAATIAAKRIGEMPRLVLVTSTPGHEEAVIAGIQDAIGTQVPIVGGSAADDAIAGGWSVMDGEAMSGDGLVISVWYPSCRIAHGFQSGYEPTQVTGRIDAVAGRVVQRIDGQPAAVWYSSALGGALDGYLGHGGSILMETTLHPLGREVGQVGAVPYHQLSHPERIFADGSMSLFTEAHVGDRLVLMTGTPDALVDRAGRALTMLTTQPGGAAATVLGGFLVYCAGCMLTVRDRMDQVVGGIRCAMRGAPFVCTHTFGEQGCFVDGANRHGNLMIAAVVLLS